MELKVSWIVGFSLPLLPSGIQNPFNGIERELRFNRGLYHMGRRNPFNGIERA